MIYSVFIEPNGVGFLASVVGSPHFNSDGATRVEALTALEAWIEARLSGADTAMLPITTPAVSEAAGTCAEVDAEILREICDELYRERDFQKAVEFPGPA